MYKKNIDTYFLLYCLLGILFVGNEGFSAPLSFQTSCLSNAKEFKLYFSDRDNHQIPIGKNSLAATREGYNELFEKIYAMVPTPEKFIESHFSEFKRQPLIKDSLQYIAESSRQLVKTLNELRAEYPDARDLIFSTSTNVNYDVFRENKANEILSVFEGNLSEAFDPSNPSHWRLFLRLLPDFHGNLGEFDVAMRLNHVLGKGVTLRSQYRRGHPVNNFLSLFQKHLKARLQKLSDNLDHQKITELNNRFPHIFKNNTHLTAKAALKKAVTWIETKEFDVISLLSGTNFAIVEVKNYAQVMQLNTILDERQGKSILSQQLELLDIISFLKLENRLMPFIAFRNGVSADGKTYLEKKGIHVLGPVIYK